MLLYWFDQFVIGIDNDDVGDDCEYGDEDWCGDGCGDFDLVQCGGDVEEQDEDCDDVVEDFVIGKFIQGVLDKFFCVGGDGCGDDDDDDCDDDFWQEVDDVFEQVIDWVRIEDFECELQDEQYECVVDDFFDDVGGIEF